MCGLISPYSAQEIMFKRAWIRSEKVFYRIVVNSIVCVQSIFIFSFFEIKLQVIYVKYVDLHL